MKEYKDVILYRIVRPIITVLFKFLFRPRIVGVHNIPISGKVILAGNHTNNLDSVLLLSSTKRNIHFLAKKELFVGIKKIFIAIGSVPNSELFTGLKKILFNNLGLIPVDRSKKDSNVLKIAEKYLKNNLVVGIFPEGTTEKGCGYLLPFKIGAVKLANDTNTKIIPFKISGSYKLFSKDLKIIFSEPYKVKKDLEKSNKELYNIINNIKDV